MAGPELKTLAAVHSSAATVWDAIGDLEPILQSRGTVLLDELVISDAELVAWERRSSRYARHMRSNGQHHYGYQRTWSRNLLSNVGLTRHSLASAGRFAETREDGFEPISRYHRLSRRGVSNTIRAGTGRDHGGHTAARPIHPLAPRVITVREAARLHSYPDWFRFHRTRWRGFQQVGNSVPPLLGQAVAQTIADGLGYTPLRPRRRMALAEAHLLGGIRAFGPAREAEAVAEAAAAGD
jgi:DNA (cytosine-5)-methyltransferase 1